MADTDPKVGRFQAGGALGEEALYVPRRADRDLLDALSNGELCYVLATSQTGKSSLKVRAARALEAGGVRAIDITLSRGASETEWSSGSIWASRSSPPFASSTTPARPIAPLTG